MPNLKKNVSKQIEISFSLYKSSSFLIFGHKLRMHVPIKLKLDTYKGLVKEQLVGI